MLGLHLLRVERVAVAAVRSLVPSHGVVLGDILRLLLVLVRGPVEVRLLGLLEDGRMIMRHWASLGRRDSKSWAWSRGQSASASFGPFSVSVSGRHYAWCQSWSSDSWEVEARP